MELLFCPDQELPPRRHRYDRTKSSYAAMIRMVAVWLALAEFSLRALVQHLHDGSPAVFLELVFVPEAVARQCDSLT